LRILVLLGLALLGGCGTTGTAIAPQITRVNFPEVNSINTVRIGDSMLKKAKVYAFDAIQLEEEYKWGDGFILKKFTFPPQKLPAKTRIKDWTFV